MQCWVRMECRKSGCKSLVGQLQKHKRPVTVIRLGHVLKVSMWAQTYCQMINISSCAATPLGMCPVARKLPPQTIRCTVLCTVCVA